MAEGKGRESEFGHLYNRDAPWTGLPKGEDFVRYLNKTPKHELNEPEKKCLKKLEKLSENGKGEEEEVVEPNENAMPWHLFKNPSDVIYYLYGDPLPTRFNKNIVAVLQQLKQSGKTFTDKVGKIKHEPMSIAEIVEYAQAKSNEVKQNYLNDKVKEREETKDMNFLDKSMYKAGKFSDNYINDFVRGGTSGPSIFFKLSTELALKMGKMTASQPKQPENGEDKQKDNPNPDKDKQKQDDEQQEQTRQDDDKQMD